MELVDLVESSGAVAEYLLLANLPEHLQYGAQEGWLGLGQIKETFTETYQITSSVRTL